MCPLSKGIVIGHELGLFDLAAVVPCTPSLKQGHLLTRLRVTIPLA